MATSHQTDIVVIGAGPVGLFAVFQCGMLDMKCHVVDALDVIGGQCSALYPEKPIYDIPSRPSVTGQELVDQLSQQAAPFKPVYHLGQQVQKIEKSATGWRVMTSAGAAIDCKAVMIAGGAGAFVPNRPPLNGIESFEGKSVFYAVGKRENFKGKRIVIAGGGDSAVDWAISLAEVAASVAVVHRRDVFRAAPESVKKMQDLAASGKIEMVVPYQLSGLEGANGQITKVLVKTLQGEERALQADMLLPFYGLATSLGPIAEWGFDLHKQQINVTPSTCETNQSGIYCVGDMAHYAGKLKLILQGFSEVAMAAHAAYAHVYPDKVLDVKHSTDKGLPNT
jgi:thioredoxin reductase (NADPH)